MKLARLIDPEFQLALNKLAVADVPIRTAWKLKGVLKVVNEELAKYEEVRKDLLTKHGRKKEDGSLDLGEKNEVIFDKEEMILFGKAYAELTNIEIDIAQISVSELGNNIQITLTELMKLDGLIVE